MVATKLSGDDFAEAKLMRDNKVDFKLSIKPWTGGQLRFVAELVWQNVTLCEYFKRWRENDSLTVEYGGKFFAIKSRHGNDV